MEHDVLQQLLHDGAQATRARAPRARGARHRPRRARRHVQPWRTHRTGVNDGSRLLSIPFLGFRALGL